MPKTGGKETAERLQALYPQYEGALYVRVHAQFHCASRCFGGRTQFFAKAFFTAGFAS